MITATIVHPLKVQVNDNGDYPVIVFHDSSGDVSVLLTNWNQLEDFITICKTAHENFIANESQTT